MTENGPPRAKFSLRDPDKRGDQGRGWEISGRKKPDRPRPKVVEPAEVERPTPTTRTPAQPVESVRVVTPTKAARPNIHADTLQAPTEQLRSEQKPDSGGKMGEREKKIYRIALAVAVLMAVLPPMHRLLSNGNSSDRGYGLIFAPPAGASVDFNRLIIQWLVVGAIAWGVAKLGK
jgi:hypothetical protein